MSTLPPRRITPFIEKDLRKKMVFLGGPRQVGKTTLAQSLLLDYTDQHPAYLNWDFVEHRKKIKEHQWPHREKLIVLDEIHKFRGWRNLIKGFYDTLKNTHQFLITGSARLDHFRKGGDSLLGRYNYYRLHPYAIWELGYSKENLKNLFEYGGFPEPLAEKDTTFLRRWHNQRLYRVVDSDVRDLENVKEIDKLVALAEELPNRVGSPLSFKNLAQDLEVDFKTAKRWISILDSLYYSFLVSPFGASKIRAVKKEQKLYLWDWSQVEELGPRFENMVASHLLHYCHFVEDTTGHKMELRFIRDHNKRECDFVVLRDKKPEFAVEAKLSDKEVSSHLQFFNERTHIPMFYQVHMQTKSRQVSDQIALLPFIDFCKTAILSK